MFLVEYLNFTPSTRKFLIELSAVVIVVLAFMIERKGVFSILWHKKNTVTPVARTYVEHNGAASPVSDFSIDAQKE